jgi:hypothetical protein
MKTVEIRGESYEVLSTSGVCEGCCFFSLPGKPACAKNDHNVRCSSVIFKKLEKMEKEIKIVPPTGYEIDKENSTLECIKFKLIPPKKKENKITNIDLPVEDISINNAWAFSIMDESKKVQGTSYKGSKVSGHGANLFLCMSDRGIWVDKNGKTIEGYLYWKPKN